MSIDLEANTFLQCALSDTCPEKTCPHRTPHRTGYCLGELNDAFGNAQHPFFREGGCWKPQEQSCEVVKTEKDK